MVRVGGAETTGTSVQAEYLVYTIRQDRVTSGAGDAGMINWRPSKLRRVCRIMFSAETMCALDAVGAALVMRASFMALVGPELHPTTVDPCICPAK